MGLTTEENNLYNIRVPERRTQVRVYASVAPKNCSWMMKGNVACLSQLSNHGRKAVLRTQSQGTTISCFLNGQYVSEMSEEASAGAEMPDTNL